MSIAVGTRRDHAADGAARHAGVAPAQARPGNLSVGKSVTPLGKTASTPRAPDARIRCFSPYFVSCCPVLTGPKASQSSWERSPCHVLVSWSSVQPKVPSGRIDKLRSATAPNPAGRRRSPLDAGGVERFAQLRSERTASAPRARLHSLRDIGVGVSVATPDGFNICATRC